MDRLQRELRDVEFQLEVAKDKLKRAQARVDSLEERKLRLRQRLGYTTYQPPLKGWDVT